MKKLMKFLSLVLIASIISGSLVYQRVDAKDISFAGKYKNGKYVITLSQNSKKSSYKTGEKCGKMTLTDNGNNVMGGYSHGEIVFDGTPIKKIGKNKYSATDSAYSGYKCTIIVKKKSISVKFTKPKGAWKVGKNGTYTLKG